MGWRNCRLRPWSLRSKLGLAPLNRCCTNGTHDGEMSRLEIMNRGVVNDPHDRRRKNKLITGLRISIDIHERENEMRGKVYSKVLNEGKQKASTRLGNVIIVRQGMENKCHHHIKEPQTFCKART